MFSTCAHLCLHCMFTGAWTHVLSVFSYVCVATERLTHLMMFRALVVWPLKPEDMHKWHEIRGESVHTQVWLCQTLSWKTPIRFIDQTDLYSIVRAHLSLEHIPHSQFRSPLLHALIIGIKQPLRSYLILKMEKNRLNAPVRYHCNKRNTSSITWADDS